MSDIKNLENRIKNLEYYTTLSLLETNTANLFVADDDGLNSKFINIFGSQKKEQSNLIVLTYSLT